MIKKTKKNSLFFDFNKCKKVLKSMLTYKNYFPHNFSTNGPDQLCRNRQCLTRFFCPYFCLFTSLPIPSYFLLYTIGFVKFCTLLFHVVGQFISWFLRKHFRTVYHHTAIKRCQCKGVNSNTKPLQKKNCNTTNAHIRFLNFFKM